MSQATERVIAPQQPAAGAGPQSSRRPSLRNPFRVFRAPVGMATAGGRRIATPGSTVDGPVTRQLASTVPATAGLFAVLALLVGGIGGRYFLLIAFPAGLAGLLAGRWLWRVWLHRRRIHGCALSDVVVVGQPADVQDVLRQIERKSGGAYRVVGVVLDGEAPPEDEAETSLASRHAPSFLGTHHVTSAVARLHADAVIVAGTLTGRNRAIRDEVAAYAGHEGRRLFIKPGLTSLWQINGRSNLGWDENVRLDLYYVENWSVTGDLQIMWRTFKVMIQPEGAY